MASERIAVFGGGGFAREVAWLVQSCATPALDYQVVCFIDDDPALHGKILNDLPAMSLEEAWTRFPDARVVGGVGSPRTREHLMARAGAIGFEFATIIHPRVERSDRITFGTGTIVCAGNILTTNITVGQHVQINIDCTVGHEAILSDFTTLAPGVHISGWVHAGRRVYIGTGAVVTNGTERSPIVLGDDAVIGAGACVTKSVAPGLTVVGVPAKPISRTGGHS